MSMMRETGKDRWRRVPKDYFKGPDRLQGAKLLLWLLAFVLSLGWFASGIDWTNPTSWTSTDGNSLRANHGTLARVHAAWDHQCDACHVPFEPIDGRALFASASSPSTRSSDQLCMSCHAGPIHHTSVIESEIKGCAQCHRDHQGRDASLIRLADNDCTSCHAELEKHIDAGKKTAGMRDFEKVVTRFDAEHHPAFAPEGTIVVASKRQDRGKLKFNHARHMMPGIVRNLGDTPYTVEDIPLTSERSRYQGMGKPTDPVRLDCSSCHFLDPSEFKGSSNPAVASAAIPAGSPGRYYLPVTFENQCRACHTLTFDPTMKDVEIPHGVQPDQVVAFVNRTYAGQVLSVDPKVLDVFVPPVRMPGKTPIDASARKLRDDSVSRVLGFLFPKEIEAGPGQAGNRNNCLECHAYGGKVDAKGVPDRVEPTKVPEVWFTHARFDHMTHRGVSCRECHPGSYALNEDEKTINPTASQVATDYLIPAIDNCVQCHAPANGQGGLLGFSRTPSRGGASFDCTECHRYHNGDRTFEGVGASTRDATVKRTIGDFLRGSSSPVKSPRP
jgi:hypothetical protein